MNIPHAAPGFTKPITLRIIFIFNSLKILLAFGFYVAFKHYGFSVGELRGDEVASVMLYTALGYVGAFSVMVISILKRSMLGLRLGIVADFIISIPAKAIIGFVVALISMALTFTSTVKAYFDYRVK